MRAMMEMMDERDAKYDRDFATVAIAIVNTTKNTSDKDAGNGHSFIDSYIVPSPSAFNGRST